MNSRYVHPLPWANTIKKPIISKKEESAIRNKKLVSASVESLSGEKDNKLTFKELLKGLDEPKKKLFSRYFRWKFGLNNSNNLMPAHSSQIIVRHNHEY